jgi:hydroxymethylbilane synthase
MQAQAVADALAAAHDGLDVQLVFVETLGDQRSDVPLHTIGGQGVFVKEVQQAVLRGDADFAVHSAKDLPSAVTEGLSIAAFCERRDPRDALVGARLDQLAPGATVATGSVRRRAQLAAARPDLRFVELRGNIHTRLSKVPTDGAIVMAVAALQILGLEHHVAEVLPVDEFVPSPGQGCVAVECRSTDQRTALLLSAVDHAPTRRSVELERAFLARLGTGCSLPLGAFAHGDQLRGFLADPESGQRIIGSIALGDDQLDALVAAAELADALQQRLQGS